MRKMKVLLCVVAATLLLSPLTGCGSKDSSGGGNAYYHNDPWAHDRYYRSRVYHHHYRPARPPARPARPVHLPARRR